MEGKIFERVKCLTPDELHQAYLIEEKNIALEKAKDHIFEFIETENITKDMLPENWVDVYPSLAETIADTFLKEYSPLEPECSQWASATEDAMWDHLSRDWARAIASMYTKRFGDEDAIRHMAHIPDGDLQPSWAQIADGLFVHADIKDLKEMLSGMLSQLVPAVIAVDGGAIQAVYPHMGMEEAKETALGMFPDGLRFIYIQAQVPYSFINGIGRIKNGRGEG